MLELKKYQEKLMLNDTLQVYQRRKKKIDTSQGTNMVLDGSFVCLVLGLTEGFGIIWVLTSLI